MTAKTSPVVMAALASTSLDDISADALQVFLTLSSSSSNPCSQASPALTASTTSTSVCRLPVLMAVNA